MSQNNQQFKIRLYGVDCRESSQEFGRKAKDLRPLWPSAKNVEVNVYDVDKYQRIVGVVSIDGKTVNEALLKNGYAWLYTKYCDQSFCSGWKGLEKQASSKHIGLWVNKAPMPPLDWRKHQRGEQQTQSDTAAHLPEDSKGVFHDNATSHVFHSPGCQHYNRKNCTEIFRSAEEAVRAGFRKHDQCVGG